MRTIKLGRKKVCIPETWAELTADQYLMYLTILARRIGYQPDVQLMGSNQFFSFLIGYMGADFRNIVKEGYLPELEDAFEMTRREFPMDRVPDCKGRNLMQEWEGRKGPGDMLDGMTWGEFTKCSAALGMISTVGDAMAQEAARVMYRLPEKEPVSPILAIHCLGLISSVMHILQQKTVNLDGEDIDFSILFRKEKGRGRKKEEKTGWNGVTFSVAESGVFGNFREVNETGMWEVLLYLYKCRTKSADGKG